MKKRLSGGGVVATLLLVQKIPGLSPAQDKRFKLQIQKDKKLKEDEKYRIF